MNINVNGLFNPENRFWAFMEKVMNLCIIILLWLFCSLPVFTIGASTSALFGYTLKLIRNEEGYVLRTFVHGFRRDFVRSTVLWLGVMAAGGVLSLDLYYCQFLGVPAGVKMGLRIALGSLGILYLVTAVYLFPLTAYIKAGIKQTVIHSFIMAVGNLWISLAVYLVSFCLRYVFEKYGKAES